ncbi:MAG: potassium/proton antiporter [Acetobacteraceae bacterium]|nr:potassium/proton antiporter [Acetobacteraceae bacterium]
MAAAHEIILIAGVLCLVATLAGVASARFGTPLLLVFIGVGILAGEDGPGGIPFDDFPAAYLVGSLSLAAILFEGGLGTSRDMIRRAIWPAFVLATAGVAISAGVVGAASVLWFGVSWPQALLLGAATAPTDAAAVLVVLRTSRFAVPKRVAAALEVESGLNDPMSVFLTLGLVTLLTAPEGLNVPHAALLFAEEMAGGAAVGIASGLALWALLRRIDIVASMYPVLAVGGALATFGAAQVVGASGFLAVYLAGIIVGNTDHPARLPITRFFGTLGWLAQIVLFLMLGLLVTPHELGPAILPALAVTAVLVLLARPLSVLACLLPFGWSAREAGFVAWAGLRGAVPIFLTIVPLLAGLPIGRVLFHIVFVAVIVSVAVQGWTVPHVARLLRLRADPTPEHNG